MISHFTRPAPGRPGRSDKIAFFVSYFGLIILLFTGTGQAAEDLQILPGTIPNPAAYYCSLHGYEYTVITTPAGQQGVCTLPDGAQVDAWSFYRGEVGEAFRRFPLPSAMFNETNDITRQPITHQKADLDSNLPQRFDWRTPGACTPIRNQGSCNSCWAFASIGVLESAVLIKDGLEMDFSEQWLVSCGTDGWSCSGGAVVHEYLLWKTDRCGNLGAVLEADFPYQAADVPCDCPYRNDYLINDWGYVGNGESVPATDAIKQCILDYGPVCVGVSVNPRFSAYSKGIFDGGHATGINHYVVLVGWDDNQGNDGIWILRNCWGTGWGEDGYMRIGYNCNMVGFAASWLDYAGSDKIKIEYPRGNPAAIPPNENTSFLVKLTELLDFVVPGSAEINYRQHGDQFFASELIPFDLVHQSAILTGPACNEVTDYYIRLKGEKFGPICDPPNAPDDFYTAQTGEFTTLFADDFETDRGWIVMNNPGLIAGHWERGVPVGGGDLGDPPADYDGSGSCFLTGNSDGNSDVDLDATYLVSPPIDVNQGDRIIVSYALWYTNRVGNDPFNDVFRVSVSSNTFHWVTIDSIGPHSKFGWDERSVVLNDFINFSSQVRIRFEASDFNDISIVEAGVDAFSVKKIACREAPRSSSASATSTPISALRTRLHSSRPNPFSVETIIAYEQAQSGPIELSIYGIDGRHVRNLMNRTWQEAGEYRLSWDGCDDLDQQVPAGVYYYRLVAPDGQQTRQVLVLE